MGKVGIQIYTLREIANSDLLSAIDLIAQAGYDGIEFDAGMLKRADPHQLREWVNSNHLSVIGLTLLLPEIEGLLHQMIDYACITGAEWIVMPWIDQKLRKNQADYERVAGILNQAGYEARQKDLRFAYHIHGYEFTPLEHSRGFDILIDKLDPNYVELQVDTFWVASGGEDIVEFSRNNIKRIGSFHLKDAASLDPLNDTEVGEGILDIQGIVNLGVEQDVEWFIVEQEGSQHTLSESITISQVNLRKMLKKAQNF